MRIRDFEDVTTFTTTEETIGETIAFLNNAGSGVIRVGYNPPIDRNPEVLEALLRAVERGQLVEIIYLSERAGFNVFDPEMETYSPLTEGERRLFSLEGVNALAALGTQSGSSCLQDCTFKLECTRLSYVVRGGNVSVNPGFGAGPTGEEIYERFKGSGNSLNEELKALCRSSRRAIIYGRGLEEDGSFVYSSDSCTGIYALMNEGSYRNELKLLLEHRLLVPHLRQMEIDV